MSRQNGQDGGKQVIDEDGDVDTKVKDTIIEARNRVDKARYKIHVEAPLEGHQIPPARQTQIFAKVVKQFPVRIEPLLSSDEIQGNEEYYHGTKEPFASFELVPPDTEGYPVSLVTRDHSEKELRQMIGLPRGVELPEPRTIAFHGLKDVIERPIMVQEQWEICVEKSGAPPNWEYVYPTAEQLVPDQVYVNAVRQASHFLQDIGIGVETGLPEVDERADPF